MGMAPGIRVNVGVNGVTSETVLGNNGNGSSRQIHSVLCSVVLPWARFRLSLDTYM